MRVYLALASVPLLMTAGIVQAQDVPYTPPERRVAPTEGLVAQIVPRGETPRLPNGRPDLSGNWSRGGPVDAPMELAFRPRRALYFFEPDQSVMQRGSAWNKPNYKPEYWETVFNTDFSEITADYAFHCQPKGVPRQGAPVKIVQTDDEVALFNTGYQYFYRVVPTDGRERQEVDYDFSNFGGVPIGRWEGDVLVIESVGFSGETWLSWHGYVHSDRLTVTERLWREGDVLYYNFTADDPEMLVEPWTSETFIRRLDTDPNARYDEAPMCVEEDAEALEGNYYRG
jgi:hypothetical protein